MKILFFQWGTNNENRIIEAFNHLPEYEVITMQYKIHNYTIDLDLSRDLIFLIQNEKCDCIFSINFIPVLSDVANATKKKYISWIQDSPNLTLYYDTVSSPYNHIYSFDSYECQKLASRTTANIHYLPLATDPAHWDIIIKRSNCKADEAICFLGNSYKDTYFDKATSLTEYEKGYFTSLMEVANSLYGLPIIEEAITSDIASSLIEKCDVPIPQYSFITEKELATYILERKLTSIQRINLIRAIADKYTVNIYSERNDWNHHNIVFKGHADYETEMPIIFNKSAINLNFTLRTIHSGMPLRILDILACQGFCISNYQADIADAFSDNEIILFDCEEDLLAKIEYYMNNPDLRKRIASAGKEKIEKYYTYEYQLKRMLTDVFDIERTTIL